MKFPSISSLAEQAGRSFKRFHTPILFAVAGSLLAIAKTEDATIDDDLLVKILCTLFLGLPLSLGSMLYAERGGRMGRILQYVIVPLFLAGYFIFYAPDSSFGDIKSGLIFFVLNVCLHLWVAVSSYTGRNELYGFWRFNEALFARLVISAIFSAVLFAGLALALFAIDNLFKVKVHDTLYADIWVSIVGIFNTWFFLSGIPENFAELNNEKVFSKALKIFTQYILIPLATLYMLILYAYGLKILLQWSLPKGWVSTLILSYAIVGILSILLAYPLRDDTNNTWVRFFARFFFIALLPLIILLYTAIGVRVNQYGITELRYYLLLLGTWLAFIALYYIFSKKKNIKLIPASLAIAGFFTLFGPWSAFSVSQRSQLHRLEDLLAKYKIWAPGKRLAMPDKIVTQNDGDQVRSIIDYFTDRDELMQLQPLYTGVDLRKLKAAIHKKQEKDDMYSMRWNEKRQMKDTLLSLMHIVKDVTEATRLDNSFDIDTEYFIDTRGYNISYEYTYRSYGDHETQYASITVTDSLCIKMANDDKSATIFVRNSTTTFSEIDIMPLIHTLEQASQTENMPVNTMTIYGKGIRKSKLVVKHININRDTDAERKIYELQALLLME